MLQTSVLATVLLALATLTPLAPVHATTQTTSFSQTITFHGQTITVSGTITVDTIAKTLSATVSVKDVNSTTGATIFSKTFSINLSFGETNSLRFVLNIPAVPLMLAASCSVTTGGATSCIVTKTPDLDHDGTVSIIDFGMIAAAFGSTAGSPRYNPFADLNGDGTVSIIDIGILGADFGAPVY